MPLASPDIRNHTRKGTPHLDWLMSHCSAFGGQLHLGPPLPPARPEAAVRGSTYMIYVI